MAHGHGAASTQHQLSQYFAISLRRHELPTAALQDGKASFLRELWPPTVKVSLLSETDGYLWSCQGSLRDPSLQGKAPLPSCERVTMVAAPGGLRWSCRVS